jgi:uncharacterized membrane protein
MKGTDTTIFDSNTNNLYSDNDMIASSSSVIRRNVQSMLSRLKEDLFASVDECVSQKLQSTLSISSPLSSTHI